MSAASSRWLGVIVLPITSGDTALRALRLTVADSLHIKQDSNGKRLALSAVIFALVAAILVWAKSSPEGFSVLWRYFAWANQTLALFAFVCISVWMFENGKSKWVWMPLIPGCVLRICHHYLYHECVYRLQPALDCGLHYRHCLRCCFTSSASSCMAKSVRQK